MVPGTSFAGVDMMQKRRKEITVSLAAAVLLAALSAPGCGNQGAAHVQDGGQVLVKIASGIAANLQPSRFQKVVGDKVVTYEKGDLRGSLPPAEPVQLITRGNPDLKRVAITIDDGWNADMRILDLLKSWKIRFTAFLIGGRGVVDANPGFVRAIKEAGGEVCNHTFTHYVMKGKDEATVLNDIWWAQDNITHITHEIYPYVRFSGGAYDDNTLQWAAREGFWVVNWSVSSGDTANGISLETEVASILNNVKPGDILLFHFGGHNTYEVLARTIPEMQKRGLEVTSLTRVLEGTPFVLKGNASKSGK